MITDWLVADEAKLLRLSYKLVILDLPDSKCVLVFVDNRLFASFATDHIFLAVDHRIVVREELSQCLFNILDSLVVYIKHLMWYLLIIQTIFYSRLARLFWGVVLLLHNCVLTEELDPILEGWQDSIR